MSLLLNIDTAVQAASVCLSSNENIIATAENPVEKDSAAWLHVAISKLLQQNGVQPQQLSAVAVSAGPGSYTGLRVGMSAAKGLCYALSIPLISINTLQMMAAAVNHPATNLLCPMIDARRMEVFTALFDTALNEVLPSTNLILHTDAFQQWLTQNTITFFGNGSTKAATVLQHPHATFAAVAVNATAMVPLSADKHARGQFSNLAYTEPFYGKDFHSSISKMFY